MKNFVSKGSKILGVILIPSSFSGRVQLIPSQSDSASKFEVIDLKPDDDISSLIKSLEAQLGKTIRILETDPETMVLSTQDDVPIK